MSPQQDESVEEPEVRIDILENPIIEESENQSLQPKKLLFDSVDYDDLEKKPVLFSTIDKDTITSD